MGTHHLEDPAVKSQDFRSTINMKWCAAILLLSLAVTYVHGFSCPENWNLVGETCYKAMWLARAHDPELMTYLSTLCIGENGKSCWVGGKTDIDADTITWLDDEVTSFADAPWGEDQPVDYAGDRDPMCAGVMNGLDHPEGGLANGKCKWTWYFICELPASASEVAPTMPPEPPVTEDPHDFVVDPGDCRFEVSHGMSTDGAVCNMDIMDLDDCRDHCFADPNCVAIDWNHAERPWEGCRCWTHMEHFTETYENKNVDHYRTMPGNC